MATQYEQQLVQQYGQNMQSLIEAERAKGKSGLLKGVNVDPQDVAGLVKTFQLNPQGVFSTSNIAQASTTPAVRPDDLLGIRSQIGAELGLPGLNKQYQDLFAQMQAFDQGTTGQQISLEAQPVALNVIRGEQAEAGRQRAFTREGMARQMQVAQSALAAAQQEQESRYAIREREVNLKKQLILENPGAGITFGDSIESAASKIKKYQDKVRKQEEEAAEKRALKDMAMQLGLKTSGSRKDLRKRIAKSVKSDKEYERLMDKIKLAKSGSSTTDDNARKKAQFYSDAASYRKMVVSGEADWGYAWNSMKAQYPEVDNEVIDDAIGQDLRREAYPNG